MGKQRARAGRSKRNGPRWWLGAAIIGTVGLIGVAVWRGETPQPVKPQGPVLSSEMAVPSVPRRETRPTLDPGLFVGKAALAHQVAREIPDVLDRLHCYCYCDKHLGHKSLLSCYTDGHAAT